MSRCTGLYRISPSLRCPAIVRRASRQGRDTVIELYGMASPNVLKVVLMLEELGLPYNFNHVNMIQGDQYSPAFLAINPNGKVPAIVDSDGPGGKPFTVFESGAILMYLADKTG